MNIPRRTPEETLKRLNTTFDIRELNSYTTSEDAHAYFEERAKATRRNSIEFFLDDVDDVYGGHFNIGIQISLTCVALMIGWKTIGVMYVPKSQR